MNNFERFNEEKLAVMKYYCSSIKKGKLGHDGKISDGHIILYKIIWRVKKYGINLK